MAAHARPRRPALVADRADAGGRRPASGDPDAQGRVPGRAPAGPERRGPRHAGAGRRPARGPARGGARMTAALRRSLGSLSIPNYRRYFTGQVISISGNWMQIVAEMWLVVRLTDSGLAVGLTAALQFLPILLFGALGGVVADRHDKRRLLMRHPGDDDRARAHALRARRDGPCRGLDGARPGARARRRQRGRQPDPSGLRDGARRARPDRQRGVAEQRHRPYGADRGPGARRRADRARRRRAVLRASTRPRSWPCCSR